jgi:hypothetical protein
MSPSRRVAQQPRLAESSEVAREVAKETRKFRFPFFQKEIPESMQPMVQLEETRSLPFADWADDDAKLRGKLFDLYLGLMAFLCLPASYVTFHNLPQELPNLIAQANLFTFPLMLVFVFRLRAVWGFASKRLKEDITYYESGGEGRTTRKDKETKLRDRLVGEQEVAPRNRRLTLAMLGLGGLQLAAQVGGEAVILLQGEEFAVYTPQVYLGAKADAINYRFKYDDDFANEQARRANSRGENRPAYCNDAYAGIRAGNYVDSMC